MTLQSGSPLGNKQDIWAKKVTSRRYGHQPLPTVENEKVKLTLDVPIYTDKILRHNRSNTAFLLKESKECIFIIIAVPADQVLWGHRIEK